MAEIEHHSDFSSLINDARALGVLRQSLCEATGGFAAGRFPADDTQEAAVLLERFEAGVLALDRRDILLVEKCVAFALKELGEDEFQTVTGYDFSVGVQTLNLLKRALLE